MSAIAGTTEQARVRLVSPILLVMVALSAYGAWSLWQDNGGLSLALGPAGIAAWLVWAVYGFVAVAIVVALQRFARRPAWSVLLALAWGGFAATWAAATANAALSTIFLRTIGTDPHAWLSTPVIEESLKALGVLGLVLIPVLRRPRALDGLFYGVLVGAGFQVVEDAVYTITSLLNVSDPSVAIIGTVIMRGFVVGLFTHAVYTGVIGAAIGWAASAPAGQRGRRTLGALGVFVLVMVTHGVFNTQDSITPVTFAGSLVPLVVLLLLVRQARRGEVAALASQAAAEAGWGELAADEIAVIDAGRPSTAGARRLRDGVIAFAWAADHLGPESRQGRRAAERLAATRQTAG